ncbi:SAM domain-containing protein SAMSN-1 isoform X1 [Lepus europaeus]|uniref:SAM domain-containing protein SAMSN-1 isoform X1 n=1 Tax=Lepus europaeus TaxID=9983 RepID=UPI002B47961B|nr:SAM domain-containing protein SAMSN-1 isoform X1 [Lepus europaeus]XP_062062633.1 SAM domain-containing protein SAMSN-1 isoform X1 [Lepus europaeus]XP_062062638.1 SAM domain-containing protein SAMSN-1 isoform X1 [Lepus europaeus]XP_062062646.1 SAM domain-containing protein SAMSN-1 isoform X1 [Lepus europaeus]
MNLFCFSLEGSMDSLYEPIPEQRANQESTFGRPDSPISSCGDSGQAHNNLFMEISNFENAKPNRRKSFRKCSSENKIFGKTVNDIIWQEPSKPENDSHIKRPCQLKDLNEILSNNICTLQGKTLQGTSYQRVTSECWNPSHHQRHINSPAEEEIIKSDGDLVESMGTLKRLQKLVWTKKSKDQNSDEVKPTLTSLQDEDDTLISCMRLTKPQEKKVSNVSTKGKQELMIRQDSFSASLKRSSTTNGHHLEDMLSHYESDIQMWNSWRPLPENPLWTCVDFQLAQVGTWDDCSLCTHHSHLKSSFTDVDLLHSWRSSSFGNFDRFRHNSVSKPYDSTEAHEGEPINESGEQNKTSTNGGGLGKKMRTISWTMKKKVAKKYIKALSEEKDEEDGENTLPYRNSDPVIGTHTEKISLKASDSLDSLYSGQSSSSGITSCSDGTSNRDSFRLDDDSPYSGPFCGRARVHTDFTPSPYDNDSLKIKKGDIIDIICKTPMGMWTGMLNNKVGNFKFIYVDVISEEEEAPKKIKAHRRSRSGKPETLPEFLERIHLQEYTSTLLLNGYETLEDLKDIKESHLIELNIESSEDRMRFLSAAENLDEETIQEQENDSVPLSLSPDISLNKSQLDNCPRDSGCYISSGNSDNGKEDLESENLPDMVQKISISEPSV